MYAMANGCYLTGNMKKLVIILAVFFFSCGDKKAPEPERLLSEEQMENILYDLAVLQTMSSITPQEVQKNGVNVQTYIYNKYDIDSLTLVQNQKYYTFDIEQYQKLHNRVLERLKNERSPMDTISKSETDKKLKTKSITPTIQ